MFIVGQRNHGNEESSIEQFILLASGFVFLTMVIGSVVLFVMHGFSSSFFLIRFIYDGGTLGAAPVFLLLSLVGFRSIAAGQRRGSLMLVSTLVLLAGILGVAIRLYATHIEPHWLQIRHETLSVNHWDTSASIKILHMSDIQTARVGSWEEQVIERARSLQPDLIIMTGDFLQPEKGLNHQEEFNRLSTLFSRLNPPGGIFGVYGDTDLGLHRMNITRFGPLKFLVNTSATVRIGKSTISLFGLTRDASKNGGRMTALVRPWLATCSPKDITIVAGHRPDYIMAATDLPITLCLAGHTHGGQIRIPFYGPLLTLSKVPRSWSRGFHHAGRIFFNVSAGIGCEHARGLPNIRFNCPPEMSLITISTSSSNQISEGPERCNDR